VVAALDRAVAAGLLTRATADAVLAQESLAQESLAQAAAAPTAHRSHRPVLASAVEGLGYVGGALVLVGVMLIVAQFWEDLATAARLVLIGGAGAGLLTVGLLLRAEEVPVVWRLRGFLLLLSAGAVAGTTAILVVDVVAAPGPVVALVIGSATGAYGAALWRRRDRPAQHLTTFVGLAVAVGAVFGDAVGPPVVMVLSGAVLLIAMVALVTRSKRNHPGVPAGSAPS